MSNKYFHYALYGIMLISCAWLVFVIFMYRYNLYKQEASFVSAKNNAIDLEVTNFVNSENSVKISKILPITEFFQFYNRTFTNVYEPESLSPYSPGYMGKAFKVEITNNTRPKPNEITHKHYTEEFSKHKFNNAISEMIPLSRVLPENRRLSCFFREYPTDLPTASIIIIYRNEANSTLLRTVVSAFIRSPEYLVKEIILVDDASELDRFPYLMPKVLSKFFNSVNMSHIVQMHRSEKRIGLTRARLIGAESAKGDVLVFLDSHCECWEGWLEPLLYDVKLNPKTAFTPVIENINMDDFHITNVTVNDYTNVGVFDWSLNFKWQIVKDTKKIKDHIVKSPTMAGGLFAIDRKFFFDIGSYDHEMGYWGGENIEMSFRLWTCADGIYVETCSLVGHVFRTQSPHQMPNNAVVNNKIRVASVWMDEYSEFFYRRYPNIDVAAAGDVSDRIELRKNLKCRTFSWYLKHIMPNTFYIPSLYVLFTGSIQFLNFDLCLDTLNNKNNKNNASVYSCHFTGGNQHFSFNENNEIISESPMQLEANNFLCLDFYESPAKLKILYFNYCSNTSPTQKWEFLYEIHKFKTLSQNGPDQCITLAKNNQQPNINKNNLLILADCHDPAYNDAQKIKLVD